MGNNYIQHADALLRWGIYREQSYTILWHPKTIIYSTLTPCSNHIGNNYMQHADALLWLGHLENNHIQYSDTLQQGYTTLWHPTTIIRSTLILRSNHIGNNHMQLCCVYGTIIYSCVVCREQSYATQWRTAPTGNYPENTFRKQSYTILWHPTTRIYNTLTPYNNHIQHSDTLQQSYTPLWHPTKSYIALRHPTQII